MAKQEKAIFTVDQIKSSSTDKKVEKLTNYQIRTRIDGKKYFFLSGVKVGASKPSTCFNSLQHEKIDLNGFTDSRIDQIASLVGACLLDHKAVDFSVIVGSTK